MLPLIQNTPRILRAPLLTLTGLLCLTPSIVRAQQPTSADTSVRLAQQWEDILLLQALDYLQLTPPQCQQMQTLIEATQTQTQEIDSQRAELQKRVQEQHDALVKGQRLSTSEELAVIQKERKIKQMEAALAEGTATRLTPRFTQLLSRRQVTRAWYLMQGRTPAGEAKRFALYEPASGFVLPTDTAIEWSETLVRAALRRSYPDDVLDRALTPSEDYVAVQMTKERLETAMAVFLTRDAIQDTSHKGEQPDPTNADRQEPPQAPVPPQVREALNKEAGQIRQSLASDADAYMKQAPVSFLNACMRHLTKRLFLSPRLKEVLTERTRPRGM